MEFAQFRQHRIAYWAEGTGAPVVLIHGSFATSSAWKRLVASLDLKAWRAIAPDLPGWGKSDPLRDHHAPIDFEAASVEAVVQHTGSGKPPCHNE